MPIVYAQSFAGNACQNGCQGADAKATRWCVDCGKAICDFCVMGHGRRATTRTHVLTEIANAEHVSAQANAAPDLRGSASSPPPSQLAKSAAALQPPCLQDPHTGTPYLHARHAGDAIKGDAIQGAGLPLHTMWSSQRALAMLSELGLGSVREGDVDQGEDAGGVTPTANTLTTKPAAAASARPWEMQGIKDASADCAKLMATCASKSSTPVNASATAGASAPAFGFNSSDALGSLITHAVGGGGGGSREDTKDADGVREAGKENVSWYIAKENDTPDKIAMQFGTVTAEQIVDLNRARFPGLTVSSRLYKNAHINIRLLNGNEGVGQVGGTGSGADSSSESQAQALTNFPSPWVPVTLPCGSRYWWNKETNETTDVGSLDSAAAVALARALQYNKTLPTTMYHRPHMPSRTASVEKIQVRIGGSDVAASVEEGVGGVAGSHLSKEHAQSAEGGAYGKRESESESESERVRAKSRVSSFTDFVGEVVAKLTLWCGEPTTWSTKKKVIETFKDSPMWVSWVKAGYNEQQLVNFIIRLKTKHAREGDSVPALACTDKRLKTPATQQRFKTPLTDKKLQTPVTHKALLAERKSYLKKGLTKLFKGYGYFEGTVEDYDAERDVYKIVYVDDDDEEMTYEEMKALVLRAMKGGPGCEGGGRVDESRHVVARKMDAKVEMGEQGQFYVAQENDTPRKIAKQLATCGAGNVPGAEKLSAEEIVELNRSRYPMLTVSSKFKSNTRIFLGAGTQAGKGARGKGKAGTKRVLELSVADELDAQGWRCAQVSKETYCKAKRDLLRSGKRRKGPDLLGRAQAGEGARLDRNDVQLVNMILGADAIHGLHDAQVSKETYGSMSVSRWTSPPLTCVDALGDSSGGSDLPRSCASAPL
jgi:hypothetical protein